MADQTLAESSQIPAIESPEDEPQAKREELWLPGDDQKKPRALAPTPYQISRTQTTCLIIIAAGVLFYGLYSTRALTFPIVLAAMIALPLRSVVRTMRHVGLPSAIGALIVVAILVMAIVTGAMALWEPAKNWIGDSKRHMEEAKVKLSEMRKPWDAMQAAGKSVEDLTDANADPTTLKVEVKQPSMTDTVLTNTGSLLLSGSLTISLVFLLLAFGDQLLDGVVGVMPTRGDRQNIRNMTYDAEKTISRYLLSYTLINMGLGVVIGTGMWAIGMPNPVLWGVMAACLNYIPFLGLVAGSAIVFLVGIISFDSVLAAAWAPAIYLLANGLEANIITPWLLGRSLQLNVIIIFVFIVLWGFIWGIGGAIIAVPLLVVAKVVCEHVERLKPLGRLLAS